MESLSQRMIAKWRDVGPDDIPAPVRRLAALHFMDALGVGLAASTLSIATPFRTAVAALGCGGNCTGFAVSHSLPAASAALMNGGLIHSLEFDDTHTGSIVHGSSVLAATALAVGEEAGASGREVLSAFTKAWEVFIRIGLAGPGRFQAQGFQLTSVGGAPVAALLASDLMGLDDAGMANAVGIALSQSSGVFEFLSEGATVKALHSGWAAHAGVTAALLAAGGMSGPKTALEGKFGLFRVFADAPDAAGKLDDMLADMGSRWHLGDAAFKFHPCCHYIHPFLECLSLALAKKNADTNVDSIICTVPPGAAPIICEPWGSKQSPVNGYDAKFSLPYALAAQLRDGGTTLDIFEGDADPGLVALARAITWQPMQDADFPARFQAAMTVRFSDGSETDARVEDVYGGGARPASEENVIDKFRANAARALGPDKADNLRAALLGLDTLASIGELPLGDGQ